MDSSLLCAFLTSISLWDSGLCLDYGFFKSEELNTTIQHASKLLAPFAKTKSENHPKINGEMTLPETGENRTFHPDTSLFRAEAAITGIPPADIDLVESISIDKVETKSILKKPEIEPLNVTLTLQSSGQINPFPPLL
uniref:CHT_0 protein n=1 Tax=Fopius arisanus TaxID=64838 RepID=A0A0C9PTQ3_9HYME